MVSCTIALYITVYTHYKSLDKSLNGLHSSVYQSTSTDVRKSYVPIGLYRWLSLPKNFGRRLGLTTWEQSSCKHFPPSIILSLLSCFLPFFVHSINWLIATYRGIHNGRYHQISQPPLEEQQVLLVASSRCQPSAPCPFHRAIRSSFFCDCFRANQAPR